MNMDKSLTNYLTYKTKNRWRSVSESGRDRIDVSFAYEGSLYIIYESLRPIAMQSNLDRKANIVDTMLTLIVPRV